MADSPTPIELKEQERFIKNQEEEKKKKEKEEKNENKRKQNALSTFMSVVSVLFLLAYAAMLVTAYVRSRAGDDLYFTYACAATIFVFIMTLVLTPTSLVMLEGIQLTDLVPQFPMIKGPPKEVTEYLNDKEAGKVSEGGEEKSKTGNKEEKEKTKEENKKVKLITIKECFHLENVFDIYDFRAHTFGSVLLTYLFLTLFFLGLTAFAWALFISLYHSNRQFRFGYVYIIVDFISGFVAPILLLCSITIAMISSSYYTKGKLSLRNVIPKLFYSVQLCNKILISENKDKGIQQINKDNEELCDDDKVPENVELKINSQYWLIQDQFKWDLKDDKKRKQWLEPHYSTWALWIVICIAGLFAFAQFIDATVIEEMESSECLRQFDCFVALNKLSFSYFPCDPNNNSYDNVLERTNSNRTDNPKYYCFRFKDFGFDSDVILAVGNAYALYLLQIAVFDKIVGNFHTFLHLKLHAYWTIFYITITNISAILVFIINITSDYQHLVYDVLRSWNIFNFVLYHWVVGIFIMTYSLQDQYKKIK